MNEARMLRCCPLHMCCSLLRLRRRWMLDTGFDEKQVNYERMKQRMRAADDISAS